MKAEVSNSEEQLVLVIPRGSEHLFHFIDDIYFCFLSRTSPVDSKPLRKLWLS